MWRLFIYAVSATPTADAWYVRMAPPEEGEPDDCVPLIVLRSAVRDELRGIGASCDMPGVYNQPMPIVELLNGTFSRRIKVCVPAGVQVPSTVTCTVEDNTGVWLTDAYVDLVDGWSTE